MALEIRSFRTRGGASRRRRRPGGRARQGRWLALGAIAMVISGLSLVAPGAVTPAQARTTSSGTISGLACTTSSTTNTSNWGSISIPAQAVAADVIIVGGGGAGGDTNAGTGGRGGNGGFVNVRIPLDPNTANKVLWGRVGCGGTDADSFGDWSNRRAAGWSRGGPAEDFGGGGGGGSTSLCVGTSASNCSGGTVWAVAGGGGGGGKGSGTGACSDQSGGRGGSGGSGGEGSGSGGTWKAGNNGAEGGGSNSPDGGTGGGSGGGAAGSGGSGSGQTAGNGANVAPDPGESGAGGRGGNGDDGITGGGGGGGYTGGGGGRGGRDGNCVFGNWDGAGGGGGGSSWVRNGTTVFGWGVAEGDATANCSSQGLGASNNGRGADAGNGNRGCHGWIHGITWTINEAPTGAGQTVSPAVNKGVGRTINLANSDDGPDTPLTCEIVSSPSKGTLSSGTSCSRTYTASANTSGNDSFTYRVRDAYNLTSATYTVTIPIANINPTGAAQGPINVNKTTPATTINLANADVDGDTRTCVLVTAPTKGSLTGIAGCNPQYTGNPNQIGADSFVYRVDDSVGGQSPTYTVSLNILNRTPSGANQSLTVDAGLATAVAMANSDVDGDTLTCPTSTPTKGVLSGGTSCARTYTSNAGSPNNGIGGADSFTYNATDVHGAQSPTGTVSITIVNPDLSLTKSHSGRFQPGTGTGTYTIGIANSNTSTANGTTTITDTLPAGMTYRSHNVGSSGFTCSGLTPGVSTTITCTRASQIPKNFSSSLTITVDVAENAGSPVNNTAVITSLYELASTAGDNTAVDATDVNRRPTAANVNVGTTEGNAVVVGLVGNDADNDALTYSIVAPPFNGTLSGSGASRQYIPDGGFVGVDQFTYRVTDTDGLQSTVATVKIYVGVSDVGGVVTNEVTSAPLANMDVYLIDNSNPSAVDPTVYGPVQTDALGAYDLASLFPSQGAVPFGNYVLRFVDPARNFISEFHVDSANRAGATNVAVSDATPVIQIDAALTPGGRIQGVVRSTADGTPTIDGLQVRLFKIGQSGSKAATTAGGAYEFDLLTAGDYQLWFRDVNSGQWVSEWYDEQTTQANAATISLAVGQQLVINEFIAPVVAPPPPTTGTVTGTVRSDQLGNAPISGIQVRLYAETDGYSSSKATTTDANGAYTFTNVLAGNYKLWFRSVTGNQWVSEYHDNKATLAAADPIAVVGGANNIDAFLSPPAPGPGPSNAVITGTVTELDGVTPIAGLQVRLYVNGVATGSTATTTDANGNYTFTGRAPGQYQIWFRDVSNSTWLSEWHLDQPSQATATPVTASSNTTTTVNAQINYK